MSPTTSLEPIALRLVEADGLLTLDVRWQYAEAVQAYLHKHGIGSTLHLDPATGAARLEVWPDCSATVVRGLLTRWRG